MQEIYEQLSLGICQRQTATVEDFLARLSVLLESGEASKIQEGLYSLKLCGLPEYASLNIFSLKTSRGFFPTIEEKLLEQSSKLYGNLGMMRNGRCATLRISEFRKTGNECSLLDILEDQVDSKYFLSPEKTAMLLGRSEM